MSSHTPGPWGILKRAFPESTVPSAMGVIHGPGTEGQPASSHWVADVGLLHDGDDSGSMANAKLIAAAPELLDALRSCVAAYDKWLSQDRTGQFWQDPPYIVSARAAIAKATA